MSDGRRPAGEKPPAEPRCTCPFCLLATIRDLIEAGRVGVALTALARVRDAIDGMGLEAVRLGYGKGYDDAMAGLPDQTAGPCFDDLDDDDDDHAEQHGWEH